MLDVNEFGLDEHLSKKKIVFPRARTADWKTQIVATLVFLTSLFLDRF